MKRLLVLLVLIESFAAFAQSGKATSPKSAKPFALLIRSKPVVAVGTPIEIHIRLTNTSAHDIDASSVHQGTGFCPTYIYGIHDQSGNAAQQKRSEQESPGSLQTRMLKPGASREDSCLISDAFDMWTGTYAVQLSKPVSDSPGAELVKSNKITITVTP